MKYTNDLKVVLIKTINNKTTKEETRKLAEEALYAIKETTRELDDENTKEEATNRLWRTFRPRKHSEKYEEKI